MKLKPNPRPGASVQLDAAFHRFQWPRSGSQATPHPSQRGLHHVDPCGGLHVFARRVRFSCRPMPSVLQQAAGLATFIPMFTAFASFRPDLYSFQL